MSGKIRIMRRGSPIRNVKGIATESVCDAAGVVEMCEIEPGGVGLCGFCKHVEWSGASSRRINYI